MTPGSPRRGGHSWTSCAVLSGAALLQIILLWGTEIPLGVPGEWTWPRIDGSRETLFSLVLLIPVATGYVVYVQRGFQLFNHLSPRSRNIWLGGLYLFGLLWTWQSLASLPGVTGLARLPLVLYFHGTSGYYTQAKHDVDDIPTFLRTYPDRIADPSVMDNYLHLGTHPPGLTVGYKLLQTAAANSPFLQWLGTVTQPREVSDVLNALAQAEPDTFSIADASALWLAACFAALCATATLLPLYRLLRTTTSPRMAWLVAAIWPLVPSVLVFLPKSDLLFPLLLVSAEVCWLISLNGPLRWHALTAGCLLGLGMWFSLAMIPVGAILFLQASVRLFVVTQRRAAVQTLAWGAVGFVIPLIVAGIAGAHLPYIWYLNYHNHAAFYDHNTRSPGIWLGVNILELICSLGAPVVCWGVLNSWDTNRSATLRDWTSRWGPRGAVVIIWGLLWLAGKNMGEAARLWCFLFPFGLWLCAPQETDDTRHTLSWSPVLLITTQLIVAFATAARVKGLDLGV